MWKPIGVLVVFGGAIEGGDPAVARHIRGLRALGFVRPLLRVGCSSHTAEPRSIAINVVMRGRATASYPLASIMEVNAA